MAVPIPDGVDRRTLGDRLLRINEVSPFPAFRLKKGVIHAAEVVGCVQVGALRINVLPKLDTPEPTRDRDFLLNMLRQSGYLTRSYVRSGGVRASARDPVEVMISEVAFDMTSALKDGIPRRYAEVREDSSTLRGRIDFTRLSTRLPTDRAVLPMRYSPLSNNNELARCIKWVASRLFELTRSSVNRQALAAIVSRLNMVDAKQVTASQFDGLNLSRYEAQWIRPNTVQWSKAIPCSNGLLG